MPRPCLWPGVWNDTLPDRAYFAMASNSGARRWSSSIAAGTSAGLLATTRVRITFRFGERRAGLDTRENGAPVRDDVAGLVVRRPEVLRHPEDPLVGDPVVVPEIGELALRQPPVHLVGVEPGRIERLARHADAPRQVERRDLDRERPDVREHGLERPDDHRVHRE